MNYVSELNETIIDIMLDLRFIKGLDDEKVSKMREILTLFIDEWKEKDYIPKSICSLFIDFYPAVEASACMYAQGEKERILQFADEMCDLMRTCVDVKEEYNKKI